MLSRIRDFNNVIPVKVPPSNDFLVYETSDKSRFGRRKYYGIEPFIEIKRARTYTCIYIYTYVLRNRRRKSNNA